VHVTGVLWLDPIVAILIATNILREASSLILRAFRGLIDQADPAHTPMILETLDGAVAAKQISGYHQLKHRESNDALWVEVHMLVPGATATADAHRAVTRVEQAIRELFPAYTVHVTTHIEPEEHEIAHPEGHPELPDPYRDKSATSKSGQTEIPSK
jgi:divalent metal cation (Fe/Co/Zn/Cd) transporter